MTEFADDTLNVERKILAVFDNLAEKEIARKEQNTDYKQFLLFFFFFFIRFSKGLFPRVVKSWHYEGNQLTALFLISFSTFRCIK